MTELSGWVPHPGNYTSTFQGGSYTDNHTDSNCSNTKNCVTDEILDDAGAYSRGEFNAKKVETLTVKSKIYTSSDGVVDVNRTSGNVETVSSVELTVN